MQTSRSLIGGSAFLAMVFLVGRLQAQNASADIAYARPVPAPAESLWPEIPNSLGVQETPPAPSLEEQRAIQERLREEDISARMKFFTAIADGDTRTLAEMLNAGADANMELPHPAPLEFQKRFTEERLRYYVSSEKGVTGLMLAASLGNRVMVKFLLMAGADPMKMTKRHKTYALWMAAQYKHVEIMRSLMGITPAHESNRYRISVDLARQQATLWHNGRVEFETPISSGQASHPTETGRFLVTDKYRRWRSSIYPADMPYFMRLSCGDFGMHVGVLPGRPASHGCIRLPEDSAKRLFTSVPIGTLVEIE